MVHRGVGSSVQVKYGILENSIPAWGWAIDHAKRDFIVDMDAQITSDAQMVVMHDSTIDRTTNRTGRVHDRTLAYIMDCIWRAGRPGRQRQRRQHDVSSAEPEPGCDIPAAQDVQRRTGESGDRDEGRLLVPDAGGELRDPLKSKSMLTTRVNVHSSSTTVLGYARDAGFPNIGYGVPSTGSPPTVATMQTYKATRGCSCKT